MNPFLLIRTAANIFTGPHSTSKPEVLPRVACPVPLPVAPLLPTTTALPLRRLTKRIASARSFIFSILQPALVDG